MPPDLAARYQYLEKDLADARQKLSASEAEQKSQRQLLRQIEDAHREATATEQRFEGEREGFLMAHEGTLSDHATLLDEARSGRRGQMAHAGRVVLELRGEVKVAREVREEIHALDREVKDAARGAELARRAAGTLDARAFAQGRNFWIALGVAFVLFLLWGILR